MGILYKLFGWGSAPKNKTLKLVRGDLLKLAKQNKFDLIIHGCNCFHAMSGGIARAITTEWPEASLTDDLTPKGDETKLGTYSSVDVRGRIILDSRSINYEFKIINAYTQFNPGTDVNYDAIRDALHNIHNDFPPDVAIGIPRIGAGIAGGDWQKIENIIIEELPDRDVTIVAFIP